MSGTARFDDQVVVVTGAGGGLGRAYALLLAAEGARVVVNDYGGDSKGNRGGTELAEAVVAQIRAAGGEAVAHGGDVATEAADIVAATMDAFGRVDALVNNAGIANGGSIATMPADDFQRMIDIHLGGTVAMCRAAWGPMSERGYGRIVNTSSASVFGMPGTYAYITAKAAIFGLSRALAGDGAAVGIKVNAVMPAAYSRLTAASAELAPLMEAHFPAEAVAPMVGLLASADAPCTGETFVVGGGRAARVVLGTVPGAVGLHSIDDCLARFAEIIASDEIEVPANAFREVGYECRQLGIDPRGG